MDQGHKGVVEEDEAEHASRWAHAYLCYTSNGLQYQKRILSY